MLPKYVFLNFSFWFIYLVLSNALCSFHRSFLWSFVLSWTLRNWITCFALDRARRGTCRTIAKIIRRNDHFFACSSISIRRHDLLASKKAPRGLVERALRVRNKIDKIFTARVTWRDSRSHLQAVGLSHKVTRKFITIVIRPIHNTTAIYCRNIGSDIATVENRLYHIRVREHRELQWRRGISQISYHKLLFMI